MAGPHRSFPRRLGESPHRQLRPDRPAPGSGRRPLPRAREPAGARARADFASQPPVESSKSTVASSAQALQSAESISRQAPRDAIESAGVAARRVDKPEAAPKAEKPAAETAPSEAKKRKLSFKEKHALETLPGKIEALQKDLARLHDILADPDLYARNPKRFDEASKAVDDKTRELSAAEDEWLALEMLREELEG